MSDTRPPKKRKLPLAVSGESAVFEEGEERFVVTVRGDQWSVPSTLLRQTWEVATEVVEAYGSLVGVSTDELVGHVGNLSAQLTAIRNEFSIAKFRENAMADAKDFVLPEEVFTRDKAAYEAAGRSVEAMVSAMQRESSSGRFNQARCDAAFGHDVEHLRLSKIATEGVTIIPPESLVLQSIPEEPRKLQQHMPNVFLKHAWQVWRKGDGVMLQLSDLSVADRARLHFNAAHLTPKPDTAAGRFLGDCSNSESGQVLNTPEVKLRVIEDWGAIEHPTISGMTEEWYEYAEKEGIQLSACRLAKDDVKSAFPQMNVNPGSSYLLAIMVGCGWVLMYVTGLFGWLGFPMVFAVLSRALQRKLRKELQIPVSVYVDDVISLSREERAVSDQQYVQHTLESVFGEGRAVNFEKVVAPCQACEVIGWYVDLVHETFRPNDKGIRKLVFAFWIVASGKKYPLVVYQLLASLAERYAISLPGMSPFTYPLHAMVARFQGAEYYKKPPSSEALMSIEVWKVVSLLSLQKSPHMCRPLRKLCKRRASESFVQVYTDASPSGIGIIVYSESGQLLAYMGYQFPFQLVGSDHQNATEYFGYMMVVFFLEWVLGDCPGSREVRWINDNQSALSWAEENRCRSIGAQYAFLVITWQQFTSDFLVTQFSHQPGYTMGDADNLSRGKSHSLASGLEYIISDRRQRTLDALFNLIDPTIVRDLDAHPQAIQSVITLCRALLSPG